MSDGDGRSAAIQTIVEIAVALREELSAEIDAHPGGSGAEAGQVNRAYRAVVRCILRASDTPADDLPAALTSALRHAASERLTKAGAHREEAERLLDLEPALGDAWLAYLALAPLSVIRDMQGPSGS